LLITPFFTIFHFLEGRHLYAASRFSHICIVPAHKWAEFAAGKVPRCIAVNLSTSVFYLLT